MPVKRKDVRYRFRVHLPPARPVTTHAERSFSGEARLENYVRAESVPSYQTQIRDMRCYVTEITNDSSSEYALADLRAACLLDVWRCLCIKACDGSMDQQTEAVAEAIPSLGTQQTSRRACRYWSLQGAWAACQVPGAGGRQVLGWPEAAKLTAHAGGDRCFAGGSRGRGQCRA